MEPVKIAQPVKADEEQLTKQILGCMSSLLAMAGQERDLDDGTDIDLDQGIEIVRRKAEDLGGLEMGESVREKLAKYRHKLSKLADASVARRRIGEAAARLVSFDVQVDRSAFVADGSHEVAAGFWDSVLKQLKPQQPTQTVLETQPPNPENIPEVTQLELYE